MIRKYFIKLEVQFVSNTLKFPIRIFEWYYAAFRFYIPEILDVEEITTLNNQHALVRVNAKQIRTSKSTMTKMTL